MRAAGRSKIADELKTMEVKMSIREFVRQNRNEIDKCIRTICPNCSLNDEERKEWIRNDEGLYRWARSNGVKI
jgi:hypothetical protein